MLSIFSSVTGPGTKNIFHKDNIQFQDWNTTFHVLMQSLLSFFLKTNYLHKLGYTVITGREEEQEEAKN